MNENEKFDCWLINEAALKAFADGQEVDCSLTNPYKGKPTMAKIKSESRAFVPLRVTGIINGRNIQTWGIQFG